MTGLHQLVNFIMVVVFPEDSVNDLRNLSRCTDLLLKVFLVQTSIHVKKLERFRVPKHKSIPCGIGINARREIYFLDGVLFRTGFRRITSFNFFSAGTQLTRLLELVELLKETRCHFSGPLVFTPILECKRLRVNLVPVVVFFNEP